MIKGVNLGNWLVLEKWMSPGLFEGTEAEDETQLCIDLNDDVKHERLTAHRESYITERDFAYLANEGIDTVRIPVPFFIFGGYPPYVGCSDYLDRAFDWAETHGLRILIDLHTVPDGQNGFDNGGISGVCKWHKNPAYVDLALDVLERLVVHYCGRAALWGIEVLNEPISADLWELVDVQHRYPPRDWDYAAGSEPVPTDFLKDFYTRAYDRIRAHSADVMIVLHDGFRIREWGDFFTEAGFERFTVDAHLYLMEHTFKVGDDDLDGYLRFIQEEFVPTVQEMAREFPLIIGEWCLDPMSAQAGRLTRSEREHYYSALAAAQLSAWAGVQGLTHVLPAEIGISLGLGLIFVTNSSVALANIGDEDSGVASAMLNTSQQIGGSLGTALLNTLFASAVANYLVSHPGRAAITQSAATIHGYHIAFGVGAGLIALATVLAGLLVRIGSTQ